MSLEYLLLIGVFVIGFGGLFLMLSDAAGSVGLMQNILMSMPFG